MHCHVADPVPAEMVRDEPLIALRRLEGMHLTERADSRRCAEAHESMMRTDIPEDVAGTEEGGDEIHLSCPPPTTHVPAAGAREAPPHSAIRARHDRHRDAPDDGIGESLYRFRKTHAEGVGL